MLPALSEEVAQRRAEPAALARAVQVGLRVGALFVLAGLRPREAQAFAAVLDRQQHHFHLGPRRELLAVVRATRRAHLGVGDQTDLPGAETDEHAERLHPLD